MSPQRFTLPSVDQGKSGSDIQAKAETETKSEPVQPPYLASVALLFPVEAATLFPIAQGIAARRDLDLGRYGNAVVLAVLIAFIVLFIGVLRYFATQDQSDGKPAKVEIGIAVVSFLLWVGASGGYWLGAGGIDSPVSLQLGSPVFAFFTLMWVALVPYAVRMAPKVARRHKR